MVIFTSEQPERCTHLRGVNQQQKLEIKQHIREIQPHKSDELINEKVDVMRKIIRLNHEICGFNQGTWEFANFTNSKC